MLDKKYMKQVGKTSDDKMIGWEVQVFRICSTEGSGFKKDTEHLVWMDAVGRIRYFVRIYKKSSLDEKVYFIL